MDDIENSIPLDHLQKGHFDGVITLCFKIEFVCQQLNSVHLRKELLKDPPASLVISWIHILLDKVIIFNGDMGREMYPRLPPSERLLMPRHLWQRDIHLHTETDEAKLTKEEQEMALRKLRKQIYYPPPKIKGKEMSLCYRQPSRDPNVTDKNKHRDEEGKSCAVCLEDFEAREEVLLTPCNHMFHEDCIEPWVKDHGKCPVCRSALFERIRGNRPALHNRSRVLHTEHGLFFNELLSLIHDMDEAFISSF